MSTSMASGTDGEYRSRRGFAHVLSELRAEQERIKQHLEDLNYAISCFELLQSGGRKRRGRPRTPASKPAARYSQQVQKIS